MAKTREQLLKDLFEATAIVNSTRAGKAGSIKVAIEDNKIRYLVPSIRGSFASYKEAKDMLDNSGMGKFITDLEFFNFNANLKTSLPNVPGLDPNRMFSTDNVGSGRQIFNDMVQRIQALDPNEVKILEEADIDVKRFLSSGQMFQATFELNDETIFGTEAAAKGFGGGKSDRIKESVEQARKILAGLDLKSDTALMGQGIQILDAANAMKVIGFRYTDAVAGAPSNFTSFQANLLSAMAGNSFYNPEMFDQIFGFDETGKFTGVKAGSSTKFASKSLKIGKRFRASHGGRPISLAGDDLNLFLANGLDEMRRASGKRGSRVAATNLRLSDHVLIQDFEFDVMRNWAFGDNVDDPILRALRSDTENVLYKNLKSGDYVDDVVAYFTGTDQSPAAKLARGETKGSIKDAKLLKELPDAQTKLDVKEISDLQKMVKQILETEDIKVHDSQKGFGSNILLKRIEEKLKASNANGKMTSKDITKIDFVKAIMKSAELAKDGADVMNVGFLRGQVRNINDTISKIEQELETSKSLSTIDKEALNRKLLELKRLKRNFSNAIDHGGQVTGRISVSGMGTAKNIVSVAELDEALSGVAFILNKTSFKAETAIAGRVASGATTDFINLSGIVSEYADNVRVDFSAMAAHGSVLGTPEHIRASQQRAASLTQELNDAIDHNIISSRIRDVLDRTANMELDDLPDYLNDISKAAQSRAKQQAQIINEYILSGRNLSDNIEIINSLYDVMNREVFSHNVRKGETKMVMANVYRFGIDSEAGLYARTEHKGIAKAQQYQASELFLSGKNGVAGSFDMKVAGIDEALKISEEVIKFRIADHKVLLSGNAVAKYTHALGGFDLDDKTLPVITTFRTGNGVQKLAFDMIRQPTGPEEIMFALPNFDAETVRSILHRSEMRDMLSAMQLEFGDYTGHSALQYRLQEYKEMKRKGFTSDQAFQRVRGEEQYRSSVKLLTQIMSGDGSIDGVYDYKQTAGLAENVEQAILDLLRFGEANEMTTISTVSARQARKIQRFGTSSLRAFPGQEDVGYTTQGIFKIFDDTGTFDLSQRVDDMIPSAFERAMAQAGLGQSVINKIMSEDILYDLSDPDAPKKMSLFESRMQRLGAELSRRNPDSANIIASTIYATAQGFLGAQGLVGKSDSALGQYINTTMVVSSMMDQYQDFLQELYNQDTTKTKTRFKKVYNQLLSYNVGMISQETAIDLAINQGVSPAISEQKTYAAFLSSLVGEGDYGAALNQKGVEAAIFKMHNKNRVLKVADASLEALNKSITPGILRQTGFIRAIAETRGMGDTIGYGFDQTLFERRMLNADGNQLFDYIREYVTGYKEGIGDIKGATKAQQDLIEQMEYYATESAEYIENKKNTKDLQVEAMRFLEDNNFFLDEERAAVYGAAGTVAAAGKALEATSRNNRYRSLSRAYRLRQANLNAMLRDIPSEAVAAAQNIMDLFGQDLEVFKQEKVKDLADSDMYEEMARRFRTYEGLQAEIAKYMDDERFSRFDLINALDYQAAERKIDVRAIRVSPGASGELFDQNLGILEDFSRAERLRNINKSISMDISGVGKSLFEKSSAMLENINGATFADRLNNYVDAGGKLSDFGNELEQRLLQRLMVGGREDFEVAPNKTLEFLRQFLKSDQESEAYYLAKAFFDDEQRMYAAFSSHVQYADDQEGFERLLERGSSRVDIDGVDDVDVQRTQYKRIADKIKESEFLDYIKRPAVKKTLYGMAALIAFSFAYQGTKDRSQADMTGPPLLPGGSAYETAPDLGPLNIENIPYTGYNQGVSYDVSLHGDQDSINKFRESLGALNYDNYSTTMYNNLPRLGRDFYADAAPDF